MPAASVAMSETLPAAEPLSLEEAYRQVKALQEPGVDYTVKFMDDDGPILRRFSRTTDLEAWVAAVPVGSDGKRDRTRQSIVCPIALPGEAHKVDRQVLEGQLRDALERIVAEADGA